MLRSEELWFAAIEMWIFFRKIESDFLKVWFAVMKVKIEGSN